MIHCYKDMVNQKNLSINFQHNHEFQKRYMCRSLWLPFLFLEYSYNLRHQPYLYSRHLDLPFIFLLTVVGGVILVGTS